MAFHLQIETKKLELETNLSTNLLRRQQELEAVISSAENEKLPAEAELKQNEVDEAKSLVEQATEELRSNFPVVYDFLSFTSLKAYLIIWNAFCRSFWVNGKHNKGAQEN